MKKPLSIWLSGAILALAMLLLIPASAAVAADTYEAAWNGGYLTATANADFTEATIESVSFSFDQCETATGETSCTWEATLTLHSSPEARCNPSVPENQVVWSTGPQTGNGTVTDGSKSFSLEGCRGQWLSMRLEFHKTYDETAGPIRITGGASGGPLFTFGYHPVQEEEQRIINASPPADPEYPLFQPNFTPTKTFALGAGCSTLQLNSIRYSFAFQQMGCRKAGNLARARFLSGHAPKGYVCQRLPREGVRCWRRHQPAKFLEWHLPRLRG